MILVMFLIGLVVGAIAMDYAYFLKFHCTHSDKKGCIKTYFNIIKRYF